MTDEELRILNRAIQVLLSLNKNAENASKRTEAIVSAEPSGNDRKNQLHTSLLGEDRPDLPEGLNL